MTEDIQSRARNLVLGALVADAASLGLHWLYDQDRIEAIAPEAPEFLEPDPLNYEGFPGYFAHPGRTAGAQSQYGEQALVMAHALAENGGKYDEAIYARHFKGHFGYGGKFVGYIDHATRETLDNFRRAEETTLACGLAIPFDGDPKTTVEMVTKSNALVKLYEGDTLRTKFEEEVRLTHDDEPVVAHGFKVLEATLAMEPIVGAIDKQLPALAKLPALIAVQTVAKIDEGLQMQSVESAVRTTNNHPDAFAYGPICAKMMQAAILGVGLSDVIAAGRAVANSEIDKLFETALDKADQPNTAVTKHFGMACDMNYGVPSIVHNLISSSDYKTAIRQNIYAGGDNCGRSIVLGAIAGAVYGVGGAQGIPQEWIEKLDARDEVETVLSNLI